MNTALLEVDAVGSSRRLVTKRSHRRGGGSSVGLPACWLALAVLLLGGCAAARRDYGAFYAHEPRSILVVPVLNETSEVSASAVFLTTVTVPLAERGYYVFPVYLTDALLRDLGLPEAGLVHQLPMERFRDLFGADAVLFVTIKDWSTKYVVVQSSTVVRVDYVLRDTRTGTDLWQHTEVVSQDSGQSQDPIAMLVSALVHYVVSEMTQVDFRPLAVRANTLAFTTPGAGLPAGPRHPEHGADRDRF